MFGCTRFLTAAAVCAATAFGFAGASQATDLLWYGQSAVRITSTGGKVVVIDPFIMKNPKTPADLKDLAKVGKVDLILVTHGHGDHIGDTVELAKLTGAKVGLNADMGHTFDALGWLTQDQMIRFNKSGPISPVEGVTVTMVHAEHSSDVVHVEAETKKKSAHPGGQPPGDLVELDDGFKIYHAGDTGVFSDMRLINEIYKPDLALLPIGGHFTMDPGHAAYAVKELLKTPTVMPIHYGTFPPLKGTPEQFIEALGDTSTKVVVMEPGEERKF